ncbi:integration host factor subunit beta [bacterium]|nr:integration host factor subunit beta [bacterium]
MNKSDLINALADRAAIERKCAASLVDSVFEEMARALTCGQRIDIRGFGSLFIREHDAYLGRNPRTGEWIRVEAKRLPHFHAGAELRQRINADVNTGSAHGTIDAVPMFAHEVFERPASTDAGDPD